MSNKKMITVTHPVGGRPVKELSPQMIITLQMQRTNMTVKEMAEFHGVSEATMYRWLRKVRDVNAKAKA